MSKKHLEGGTLHKVMVVEVKRALAKFSGEDQLLNKAALELGVTPRTLRIWIGPVEKGGWKELNNVSGAMARVLGTKAKKKARKTTKKKYSKAQAAA